MKKVSCLLVLMAAMFVLVPGAYAAETKDMQGIFEECGIGALLFPSWPIGASVSNFTWDFGTTASTSGLTSPDSCKGGKARLAAYIYQSYDSLEKDIAKGDGKYLDMLASLSEKSGGPKDEFVVALRARFLKTVEQDGYSSKSRLDKSKSVYAIVGELA